jgi:hypothetical protein
MGIPAQVLQQEEEAEKLMGNPDPEEQEAEESEEVTDEDPEQQEELAPQEEITAEEQQEDTQDRAYWEQRFKVMEGKFKSEVPRLSDQIRDLTNQNDKLTNLIATMTPTEQKPEMTGGTYLTAEELETLEEEGFDKSTMDLIGSMAERVADKRLSQYGQKVDALTNDVEASSKDRFFSELEGKVSDWRAVNEDNRFIEWLSEADGYSGSTKQQSLDRAYANMDAASVAAIFNAYKTPSAPPVGGLEKQVAPGKGAAAKTPVSQNKSWSKKEITKFYADQIKGKYSEKKANQLEKDIFLAQKEGRITP